LEKKTDMVALAQTGTGKTAALVFQLFRKLMQQIQALILSPTRELCLQITNEIKKGINVAVWQDSITEQARDIKREHKLL
jgi:ATP-dependent RNA helicase DeaD